MKAFILKQEDLDALLVAIDRDPKHGSNGGSSVALTQEQQDAHDQAHRFYNYQVRRWIQKVTE